MLSAPVQNRRGVTARVFEHFCFNATAADELHSRAVLQQSCSDWERGDKVAERGTRVLFGDDCTDLVLKVEDLGLDAASVGKSGSATKVTELFAPEPNPVGVMIEGATPADAAANLVKELTAKNLL